jgi:gamma-glutamyltranspeptidase/glutathione hydrolase
MNFLPISAFVEYAKTAKSFVCRPQLFLFPLCLTGLTACGDPAPTVSDFGAGTVAGFGGAVATDEPRATLVARDVLSGGGSAADAAVAAYFTLAVTLPSTAGLGGGGACLVHDAKAKKIEAVLFLPRSTGGPVALPLNVRGMALLQARYGRMHWAQLLAPAEQLALQGTAVSRALAREIATAGDKLRADPQLASIFVGPDGQLLREGDRLVQPELGSTISQLRIQGAGALYTGPAATRLVDSAGSIGLAIDAAALRGAVPDIAEPIRLDYRSRTLFFAPPPADGGLVAAELLGLLTSTTNWAKASADEQPHLFAEASMRSFADRGQWLQPGGASATAPKSLLAESHLDNLMAGYASDRATPAASLKPAPLPGRKENPWAASFVVVDAQGQAVACNVTLDDLFGSGRMAPGTGIVLAPAPNQAGQDPFNIGPMMMTATANDQFYYAAAASGGVAAPTALAQVFLADVGAKQPLAQAIAAHRLHHNGLPDVVFYEPGTDAAMLQSLTGRGHQLQQAPVLGRVQAVWCPKSISSDTNACEVAADPRGDGLANLLQGQ